MKKKFSLFQSSTWIDWNELHSNWYFYWICFKSYTRDEQSELACKFRNFWVGEFFPFFKRVCRLLFKCYIVWSCERRCCCFSCLIRMKYLVFWLLNSEFNNAWSLNNNKWSVSDYLFWHCYLNAMHRHYSDEHCWGNFTCTKQQSDF